MASLAETSWEIVLGGFCWVTSAPLSSYTFSLYSKLSSIHFFSDSSRLDEFFKENLIHRLYASSFG